MSQTFKGSSPQELHPDDVRVKPPEPESGNILDEPEPQLQPVPDREIMNVKPSAPEKPFAPMSPMLSSAADMFRVQLEQLIHTDVPQYVVDGTKAFLAGLDRWKSETETYLKENLQGTEAASSN